MSDENVIPLFGDRKLHTTTAPAPKTQRPRPRRTPPQPTTETTAVSPEQFVARSHAVRRCMVCDAPLSEGNRTGYCRKHPAAEYRFIACSEPGCSTVKRRVIRGEDRWTCPAHRGGAA